MNKFKTKDGFLTPYSFACGYVQSCFWDGLKIELYMEHSHYHLRFFDNDKRIIWLTFDTLTPAKRLYKLIARYIAK